MFLWLPVFLGLGIALYFSLPREPDIFFVLSIFFVVAPVCFYLRWRFGWLVIPAIFICLSGGVSLAKIRTELVRAPVIEKTKAMYIVEGRLERLTHLPGGHKQLSLTELKIAGLQPEKTPKRIRITSRIKDQPLITGSTIKVRAILRPPPGPVRPEGFDFARQIWFSRLGAVGYAVSKVDITGRGEAGFARAGIERLRQITADKIRAATSGHGGDVAVALIVGEKRSIDKGVLSSIRAAGLAHMLAISGMHMALVSGTMFWVLRALLALSQTLALSYDVRKFAAVGAILIAGGYYSLSGMSISTLRAFIMITIMFVAVLLGRKAISLRNVAIAALLILMVRPESLLEVGFQMSFASVVALTAFYESGVFTRRRQNSEFLMVRVMGNTVRGVLAIFTTTLVAGLAVAPIAVYHFHHITTYSVIGNVLAMPVLSIVVMPAAIVGMIAMPFGLHDVPLAVMGEGNSMIIAISHYVAGFKDARVNVGTIGQASLYMIVAGGLWLCLWKSAWRFGGVALIFAGIITASFRPTPFLLVERDGKNIVLFDEQKMWPMSTRSARYSLDKWRSAFGAEKPGVEQPARGGARKKANRSGKKGRQDRVQDNKWRCDEFGCTSQYSDMTIAYSSHPGALGEDCARADILVATYPVPKSGEMCAGVRAIIDIKSLKRYGSHAVFLDGQKLRITNSRDIRGERPWTRSRQARRKYQRSQ